MMMVRTIATLIAATTAMTSTVCAQSSKTLTARELFYAPAKPAPAAKAQPAKPPQRVASNKPPSAKPAANKAPAPQVAQIKIGAPSVTPSGVAVIPAAYGGGRPLGLRYSLLRKSGGDNYEEVDAATVFHSGDRIRASVESNDSAYLYVVMRGSSGSWKLLFPSSEVGGGSNVVESGRQYLIPPSPGRFAFDEQAGEEKLFLVLSRRPEPSLEQLIYSLSSGDKPADEKAPKQMLIAQAMGPIDDSLVNRLRGQVYARDLIFEKVDETTPGDKKEKAVYVVSPNGARDSRLVVDLSLKHQ
jgi:Domain of unknown function (DUF4384)